MGFTALTIAAQYGRVEAIRALLSGLSPQERLNAVTTPDGNGHTALTIAAQHGQAEVIEALLDGPTPAEKQQALATKGSGRWGNCTPLDMCLDFKCNKKPLLCWYLSTHPIVQIIHPIMEQWSVSCISDLACQYHQRWSMFPSSLIYQSLGSSLTQLNDLAKPQSSPSGGE